MKLIKFAVLAMALGLAGTSVKAQAEGSADHSGWSLGAGGVVGYEWDEVEEINFGGNLRVGYGFNENFVLIGELEGLFGSLSVLNTDINYQIYDLSVKGQYFFWEGMYAIGGIGAVMYDTEVTSAEYGYVASLGVGYEWNFNQWYVAPEIGVDYSKVMVDGTDPKFWVARASVQFGWNF
jgi:hypothetical protein